MLPQVSGNFSLDFELQTVTGDAGARRYFRLLDRKKLPTDSTKAPALLAMESPVDESFPAFIRINKLLKAHGLRAPKIFQQDPSNGFMLLEDFGDKLLKDEIDSTNGSTVFKKDIAPLLHGMAQCDTSGLGSYDGKMFDDESQLFEDWFCNRHLQQPMDDAEQQSWKALKTLLIDNALQSPRTFVHRDFHCSNVMRCQDGKIGIIDFQDAVLGPASYDLISWIWDRYISWPRQDIEAWMLLAQKSLAPNIPQKDWIKHCDWMGLQRNLKIVGIFCRLNYRDNKPHYLEMLAQFCQYIIDVLALYPELDAVNDPAKNRIASFLATTNP